MTDERSTHFGFTDVDWDEKSGRVRDVFDSVANRYDLMNDLMSVGVHRLWKRHAISTTNVRPGDAVLDLAGGTGDLAVLLARKVGPKGRVVLSDINAAMLEQGKDRLLDKGVAGNVTFVQADAEKLPFEDGSFRCVTIAFGLRNVTDKDRALAEIYRVLETGGQALILEFSKPPNAVIQKMYDRYSFDWLPALGQLVTGDRDSYQYLVESIRRHPDQETLASMMRDAGLEQVVYENLAGGIVALHRGYRV